MANSPFPPRCALSRVSVFYPEFGPRVPEDHPPACRASVAASRCPRQPGPPSTSIVRSSTAVLASCDKGCTPILPETTIDRTILISLVFSSLRLLSGFEDERQLRAGRESQRFRKCLRIPRSFANSRNFRVFRKDFRIVRRIERIFRNFRTPLETFVFRGSETFLARSCSRRCRRYKFLTLPIDDKFEMLSVV